MKKPVALIILDGWGCKEETSCNAVEGASTPHFDKYIKEYPNTLIGASGEDVGLPDGQMGNSEVGHLNIGAGRVVYQPLTRITKTIRDGELASMPELQAAMASAKEKGTAFHLMGLVSDGGVHSHIDHLKGILQVVKDYGLEKVYVHAFLDGRDTPPQSAAGFLEDLTGWMETNGIGKVATVSGRYYAMDRDKRWERLEIAYKCLVNGDGVEATDAVEAIKASYAAGKDDEFVLPTVIQEEGVPIATIGEGDTVFFYNFRPDRAREITRALVDEKFDHFDRNFAKTFYLCMTQYDATIENVHVLFKPESYVNTLGEYMAKQGKTQLRIAETEKYAHVTFFFNGGIEDPYEGEERILIASPKVATYDLKPDMSAHEVAQELLMRLDTTSYDLIVLNFANPDMVGHTGFYDKAVTAVEAVDECLGQVVTRILAMGGKAIITADHGNAEEMCDANGGPMTAHTTNPVPCVIVGEGKVGIKSAGKLCDLAPTLLDMMNMDKPNEMEGESLIIR